MLSFIIRRLLIAIPLVLLSTVLVFLLVANSGDPMADLKGRNPPVPPQVIQTREHQLGLDKPMPQRYWTWLTHFVRGDMGKSIHGVEARPLLWQRMRVTLRMVVLALISFAAWSRYQRATMLDVLGSDYIRLARAKGLSRTRVMVRHALRNALIPLVTVVAIDTGAIFGGAIITERVFSWQGMGALLVQGAQTSDPNILLAWLTVTAVIVVLFNLIADLLYAVLDPRIRYG